MSLRRWLAMAVLLSCYAVASAQSLDDVSLPTYDTKYYVIHTDLKGDALREAELRMTKMAEEYRARTRGFFGSPPGKQPFYLFRKKQDYYATGVPEGSAGVFTGSALIALAGEKTDLMTWHTIQHEGFHQYVHSVIGSELPIWLNEGMAEYFGEGLFTGDGFVTGVIPSWRLDRVRKSLREGDFVSLRAMMNLPTEQWNAKLSVNNYDQAWSMVQFLAHGDGGRYERPFVAFIRDVGRGVQWQTAWQDHFGDVDAFERRWKVYWSSLPDDPTIDLYGRVATQIMTSFFARAYAQGQQFKTFEEFTKALADGSAKCADADWLPPSLGKDGAELAKVLGAWSIDPGLRGRLPRLVLRMSEGARLTGSFTLGRDGRVDRVTVTTEAGVRRVQGVRRAPATAH